MTADRTTFEPIAREAAQRAGVPGDLFVRQIAQESDWNPAAHNAGSGATGIAQIVPKWHPDVDPRDPVASLWYAARLMAGHYARFGTWAKALAAYNWGPGNVGGYTKPDGTIVPPWDGRRETLPAETRHYLDVILGEGWPEPEASFVAKPPAEVPASVDATPTLARVIELGRGEIGKPYTGPIVNQPDSTRYGNPGYDCSSFVSEMFKRATDGKVKLTPFTDAMHRECEWVRDPKPGDIVFYHYQDSSQGGVYWPHVGIWLSPTQTLDCRYPSGVGIREHVTPVGPDGTGRYRQTMRPKGLSAVALPPPADDNDEETINGLRAAVAHLADKVIPMAVAAAEQREYVLAEAQRVREQYVGVKP